MALFMADIRYLCRDFTTNTVYKLKVELRKKYANGRS